MMVSRIHKEHLHTTDGIQKMRDAVVPQIWCCSGSPVQITCVYVEMVVAVL